MLNFKQEFGLWVARYKLNAYIIDEGTHYYTKQPFWSLYEDKGKGEHWVDNFDTIEEAKDYAEKLSKY